MTLLVPQCLENDAYCQQASAVERVLDYDEAAQRYVFNPIATDIPVTLQAPTATATPSPYPRYYSALQAFQHRDFTAVISMTSDQITLNPDFGPDAQLGDYYLRSLALQALNAPEEALAMFLAIQEAAPYSFWGGLAALHFG